MRLIKLDYAVLAMLSQTEMTGYDITNKLNYIWKTTHSRVYPVLAKLEQLELTEYRLIEQSGKPDKKIYSITGKGKEVLRKWLTSETPPSSKKDEYLLKMIAIHLLDEEVIIKLLEKRIKDIENEKYFIQRIEEDARNRAGGLMQTPGNETFGIHTIAQGFYAHAQLEVIWCQWVIGLYKRKTSTNFLDEKFDWSKRMKGKL